MVWESGLGFAHHPASYFFQPTPPHHPGPLGGPQAQLPYLGAFSPARSHHASSGSQAPSLPPGALCGPHVSLSTSAHSVVLSHGDRRKESPCALAGAQNAHQGPGEEGRGKCISPALPLKGEAGHARWGLGPILHHRSQEAEAKAPARLRATETGWGLAWATLLSSPLLLPVSDCCDQPCFKHVLTDSDSVLCGLMGWGAKGGPLWQEGCRLLMQR